jgi:hypothetical protein
MVLIYIYISETNLKVRQGVSDTAHICTSAQAAAFEGIIKYEPPNSNLYAFTGSLRLREKEVALGPNQLLLRVDERQMIQEKPSSPYIYMILIEVFLFMIKGCHVKKYTMDLWNSHFYRS